MKSKISILFLSLIALVSMGVSSCSDDDLGASIFDTTDYPLDKTSYTFPLDTFVKVNFLEPYNLKFIYKMQDVGSDMQKNLVPADYDKSVELAVLSKYLWYDVYQKIAGTEFLKKYSPRIIHVIGSKSYNPSSGTETLGTAEGGLKITLYNANALDPSNMDNMNEYFFKTMHHEFSHILHQTYVYPTSFSLISNGKYKPTDWANARDSVVLGQGFVTPYASSQAREDWVEVISNYIVKDMKSWERMLNSANYDWEECELSVDSFKMARRLNWDMDSIGWPVMSGGNPVVSTSENGAPKTYKGQRKVIQRDAQGKPQLDENGNIVFLDTDGTNGRTIILQKLEMARDWMKKYFNIDLDELRMEVQRREWLTDADGNFVYDADGNFINHFTQPSPTDPSKTFMETLLDEVNKYKALQNK